MNKEKEKPEECDACGFATKDLDESRNFNRQGEEYYLWFCDLCRNTHSATSVIYPTNDRDVSDVLKALCYIGNEIIKTIKEKKD